MWSYVKLCATVVAIIWSSLFSAYRHFTVSQQYTGKNFIILLKSERTSNRFSYVVVVSFIDGGNLEYLEKTTDLSQVTDKLLSYQSHIDRHLVKHMFHENILADILECISSLWKTISLNNIQWNTNPWIKWNPVINYTHSGILMASHSHLW
jgi:hypothetical protein